MASPYSETWFDQFHPTGLNIQEVLPTYSLSSQGSISPNSDLILVSWCDIQLCNTSITSGSASSFQVLLHLLKSVYSGLQTHSFSSGQELITLHTKGSLGSLVFASHEPSSPLMETNFSSSVTSGFHSPKSSSVPSVQIHGLVCTVVLFKPIQAIDADPTICLIFWFSSWLWMLARWPPLLWHSLSAVLAFTRVSTNTSFKNFAANG